MAAVYVLDVINQAGLLLNDLGRNRWKMDELVWWVNDAQNAVVSLAPSAGAKVKRHEVKAGITKEPADTRQYLPIAAVPDVGEEGISLIAVRRNIEMKDHFYHSAGAIRLVDRELLDSRDRNWNAINEYLTDWGGHLAYVYDPATPLSFFLWPMSNKTTYVEIEYVARPKVIDPPVYAATDTTPALKNIVDLAWANDTVNAVSPAKVGPNPVFLTIPYIYREAVLNYLLFRAYSKDSEEGSTQRAQLYYQAFVTSVTNGRDGMTQLAPDRNPSNARFNPNTPSHYAK